MTQITGHAEFCELFLDDVIVPKENLLGARGDGWKIAMYTLGHERGTAALPRQVKLRTWLDRLVREAAAASSTAAGCSPTPRRRARSLRPFIGIEVLRHHAYRTVGEFLNGGAVGPDSSSVKLLMAEAEQRLAATALDVLGPTLLHADPAEAAENEFWNETYLYSRAAIGLRRHAADPAQHHRRPHPRASPGVGHGPRTDRRADLAERVADDAAASASGPAPRSRTRRGLPNAIGCGRRWSTSVCSPSIPRRDSGRSSSVSRRGPSAPTSPPRRSSAAPRCASRPGPEAFDASATRACRSRCSSPAAAGRSGAR